MGELPLRLPWWRIILSDLGVLYKSTKNLYGLEN